MNLFARAMGGIYSDILRKHLSISGRLVAHFTCLLGEGVMLIIFSQMNTIPSAIGMMILFSTCVQMSASKRRIAFGIFKCLTNKVNGQAKRVPFMYQLFMLYLSLLDL
jgi:NNP family nitrate/nitrite transporter-like MFS transporter